MRSRFLSVRPNRFHVLCLTLTLGVVGLQAVFIAHTHKMITGQPLLLGQDHRGLSHLPPLFFKRIRGFLGSAFKSPSSNPVPEASSDADWDRVFIFSFVSVSDDDARYIVQVEAPGLSVSNVDLRLTGRELAIASDAFNPAPPSARTLARAGVPEQRVRFPGPVSETGPPVPETVSEGRLRVIVQKAAPDAKAVFTRL